MLLTIGGKSIGITRHIAYTHKSIQMNEMHIGVIALGNVLVRLMLMGFFIAKMSICSVLPKLKLE